MTLVTRRLLVLFLGLFFTYAWFYQGGGWNQNSRLDLVLALIHQGTVRIDTFVSNTGDAAQINGHFYSDKAPGAALTAVPAAWFAALAFPDPVTISYVSTLASAALPTALAAVLIWLLAVRLGADEHGALFGALAFGLATPAWIYATLFFGHALAAGCLTAAAACALGLSDAKSHRWLGVGLGASAGWAIASEFPAAPAAFALMALGIFLTAPESRPRATRAVGLGLAAGLVPLAAYNIAAFGTPFDLGYAHQPNFPGLREGILGVSWPRPGVLLEILFLPYRGLFVASPLLLAAPLGMWLGLRQGPTRAFWAAAAAVVVIFLLINCGYAYWWGGWAYGPRHLVPILPFLCLGLALLYTRASRAGRGVLLGLLALSVFLTLVAVSTAPMVPDATEAMRRARPQAYEQMRTPLRSFLLPSFLHGYLALNPQSVIEKTIPPDRNRRAAWNLGQKMGLSGLASLLPLLGIWVLGVLAWRGWPAFSWKSTEVVEPARVGVLWYAATVLMAFGFAHTRMMGSDFWWHLATGRWILAHTTIPTADPWSYTTAGNAWLQHEWLTDVIYAGWERAFGLEACIFWKWLMVVGTFTLLLRVVRRQGASWPAAFLAVTLSAATAAPFFDLRPHLGSLLCYAILLNVALPPARPPLWLPAFFVLWANLHGGFFFGLLALAIMFSTAIYRERGEWRRYAVIGVACVIAACVNPSGVGAFGYPLKYAFDSTSPFRNIAEWHPPHNPGGIRAPLLPIALIAFALGAAFLVRAVDRLAALGLSALTLAMALRSRRFIPLFAMSEALVVAPLLDRLLPAFARGLPFAALCLLLAAAGVTVVPHTASAFHWEQSSDVFPAAAVDYVEAHDVHGRMFAFYNWGGYLHARTGERLQTFIDGRADTVFDTPTYLAYGRVQQMAPGWMEVVEGSGARWFLWPRRGNQAAALIATGRWKLLHQDNVSTLLERTGR